jgi:hypothetical protein
VSKQVFQITDLRKALGVGGIFAVSTVLPEKIQHLAFHVGTISRTATDEVVEHSLQVLGCFLVLSVLIWASRTEPRQVHPLLAYPPHSREVVIVHVAGLAVGVILMLI